MGKRSDLFWGAVKTGMDSNKKDTVEEKKRLDESREKLEEEVAKEQDTSS